MGSRPLLCSGSATTPTACGRGSASGFSQQESIAELLERRLEGDGASSSLTAAVSASASAPAGGAVAPGGPGTIVARPVAERMATPERLNLDRRGLTACPLLQNEERLRLLNYQNNAITAISRR